MTLPLVCIVTALRAVVFRQNANYSDDDVWDFEEHGSSERSDCVAEGDLIACDVPVGEERFSFSQSSVT